MRLQFDKSGRRFFFLTFCVRGRKAVLSRIVKKTSFFGAFVFGVVGALACLGKMAVPDCEQFHNYARPSAFAVDSRLQQGAGI